MVLFFFFSTNQNSIAWNSCISYISIWNKGAKQRGVIDLFYGNILFCVFIFMVDHFNLFIEIFQGGHGLASSFPFSVTHSETNLMILIHSKLLHKSTSFWNNPSIFPPIPLSKIHWNQICFYFLVRGHHTFDCKAKKKLKT